MFKTIKLNNNEKTILEVGGTDKKLFLLNLMGGHVVIMPVVMGDVFAELKVRKGSLSFRLNKGMKIRSAIKDLIDKAKPQKTEIIILDLVE